MNEPIPEKGRVLTGLTDYWLHEFAGDVPSALVRDPREIDRTVVASSTGPNCTDEPCWFARPRC